jgi:hypothetical protein
MLSQTPTFKIGLGVDGCGVPVFALPLRSIALSYAKLADPFGLSDKLKEVIDYNLSCIHKHPEKINDYGTPSYYINQNPDLLMKDGSRGVICMAIKSMKLGIAIKLEDGWTDEFQGFIIANILQQLHYEDEELIEKLKKCYTDSLYNDCNIKVGHAVCDFKLNISESFFEDLDDSEDEDYSSENDRDFVESLGFDNEEDLGYDEEPDDGRGDGRGSRGDGRDSRGDGHGSRGDGRDSGLDDDVRDNVKNPDDVEDPSYGRVLRNNDGTDHSAGFNSDENLNGSGGFNYDKDFTNEAGSNTYKGNGNNHQPYGDNSEIHIADKQPLSSNNAGIDSTSSTSQPQTSDNEANVNHDAAAKYEATDDDEDIDRIIALSEKKRQKNKPLSPEEAKELRNKNSLLGMNVVKPVTKRNIIVNPRVDSISQPIIMENSSEQNEPFEQETQAEQRWYSKQESEQEVHSAQETQAAQNKPYVQVKPRDGEMIYDEETNDIQNVSSSKEALSNSGSDHNQNLYDSSSFTPNKDLSQIKSANVISRKSDKN